MPPHRVAGLGDTTALQLAVGRAEKAARGFHPSMRPAPGVREFGVQGRQQEPVCLGLCKGLAHSTDISTHTYTCSHICSHTTHTYTLIHVHIHAYKHAHLQTCSHNSHSPTETHTHKTRSHKHTHRGRESRDGTPPWASSYLVFGEDGADSEGPCLPWLSLVRSPWDWSSLSLGKL